MSTRKNAHKKEEECSIHEPQCTAPESSDTQDDTQITDLTFVRLFQQFLGYFSDLPERRLALLSGVLSLAKDGSAIGHNKLFIAKQQREWLSDVTGLEDSTIKEYLGDFVWGGLMLRDERGVYRLNPYLYSTTGDKETWELREKYVFRPKMKTAMAEARYQRKKAKDDMINDSSVDCTQNQTDYAHRPLEETWFPVYGRALKYAAYVALHQEYETDEEKSTNEERAELLQRKAHSMLPSDGKSIDYCRQDEKEQAQFKNAFFQAYLPNVSVLTKLTSATLFIFLELLKYMKWNNSEQVIYITASVRKNIINKRTAFLKQQAMLARELSADSNGQCASGDHEIKGCHRGTFTKALAALCKSDLLRKLGQEQYQLNPHHLGFVKKSSIHHIRDEYKEKLYE